MKVLCMVTFLSVLAAAQQQPGTLAASQPSSLPQARFDRVASQTAPSFRIAPINFEIVSPVPPSRTEAFKTPSYLLLLAAASAATVADCEYTKALLSNSNGHEINPLFGPRPTRARLYGVSLPILGVNAFLSARSKRAGSRWWPLGLGLVTASHSTGVIYNALQ